MDSNPICHHSPAKKMKCSFLDYIQLLMIGRAGPWTQTLSTTPLQPKKWNAHFWITFNFWWLAGLVDGLEPHLPPLSSQKNKMLIFGLHSTSDDRPGWSMDLNPICHPSPAKKIKCSFFGLRSTSDDRPGWLMDWNPICHRSPAKKIKCSFLDDFQLLVIWSMDSNPSATTLQPKKWNAHFWITFNFWWLAGLVHGLKPYPPHLSSQKNEMLIFGLRSISDDRPGWSMDLNPICHPSPAKKIKCSFFGLRSTSDDRPGWSMDLNPICHPSPAKKIKCSFLDDIQLLMIGRLVDGLEPHLPPLSSQKNKMLIFGWLSTSGDRPGWSMDSNPICHPSPAKKMKCSFLDYIQLLMIGRAGPWTQTLSTTPLQPKKWNAHFWITFNFWWLAGLVNGLKPHLPPLSSQKNKMLIFGLRSTSDDRPGWSMDWNPICHPSPAKKIKCSFLDYVQLLAIGRAGQWTGTPSATPLQPKK